MVHEASNSLGVSSSGCWERLAPSRPRALADGADGAEVFRANPSSENLGRGLGDAAAWDGWVKRGCSFFACSLFPWQRIGF